MSAIVGLYEPQPYNNTRDVLLRVTRESRIRGTHAFGLAYTDAETPEPVVRKFYDYQHVENFIRTFELRPELRFLFCARYSTSGSHLDHRNNQPLHLHGIVMAFDGVIDMGTQAEMTDRHGRIMSADNDGELVLNEIRRLSVSAESQPYHMLAALPSITANRPFAGLFLANGRMVAFRNGRRPLWHNQGIEGVMPVVYASTSDILARAHIGAMQRRSMQPLVLDVI